MTSGPATRRRPRRGARAGRGARAAVPAAIALAAALSDLAAIDHKNLDEGRPLRLEDPYVIPWRSWAVETGLTLRRPRSGRDRALLPIELLYGAAPNLQIAAAATVSTRSETIDHDGRPGDLRLAALYNFNQETLRAPALGVKLAVDLPTAHGSRGAEVEIAGLLTKSAGRLGLHLNLARAVRGAAGPGERGGAWRAALGTSWPAGAPRHTRVLLLADLSAEQAVLRGGETTLAAEVGVRIQWRPRVVLDAAAGSEIRGPDDRASFFLAGGWSFGW